MLVYFLSDELGICFYHGVQLNTTLNKFLVQLVYLFVNCLQFTAKVNTFPIPGIPTKLVNDLNKCIADLTAIHEINEKVMKIKRKSCILQLILTIELTP